MKKRLLITFITISICGFVYAEQTLQQKVTDLCKSMQIQDIADAKKVSACLSRQIIVDENEPLTKDSLNKPTYGFVIDGVEQGKCRYKKIKSTSFTNADVVANCLAPLSVMQRYANNRIMYANKMCSSNGFSSAEDTTLSSDIKTLESYCK